MTGGMIWVLAAIVAVNAQAAPDVAVPLAPSGKWALGRSDGMCTLSHRYGGPAHNAVVFGLRPMTLTRTIEVFAIIPKNRVLPVANAGDLTPRIFAAGNLVPIRYTSSEEMPEGSLSVRIAMKRDDASAMLSASGLIVEAGGTTVAIAPTADSKALAALARCETRLVKTWGLGRVAAIPPYETSRSNVMGWFSNDDYPPSSLARRSQGSAVVIWRVNAKGKVEECRTVKSTGDAELDAATCRVATKRGRYSVFRDANGQAIPFWTAHRLTWRLPRS